MNLEHVDYILWNNRGTLVFRHHPGGTWTGRWVSHGGGCYHNTERLIEDDNRVEDRITELYDRVWGLSEDDRKFVDDYFNEIVGAVADTG